VNELFELSKLESGQIKLKPEVFSLPELAQDVFEKYKKECDDRKIKFITEFNDPISLITGDISWIDRLIQNLVDNAIKHVNDGGFIKITIFEKEGYQHLKVCNSGLPIPQEELPLVFDRYFKSSNNTGTSSTGLGLAIVKKIVDLHHGLLKAEADEQITTFRFAIPLKM
ncbi:MAG: HAMP domain-containing sensor histidine kinase, partial [Saprospiraceae bacterium]